ncbi:hypothetical protein TW95_gp0296 [Pandoravirus inopinatum]|uniref:Uncharacterized protein n=1 Tax=Pandoravirus inopinatum TaxID=1605721 RepID=A0A0B5J5R8_9VIRU|nr:hypothetical protein TW95_gp0296 [Pandoravirus inopinatum]AJF97030.1 hypothetical protein [Pandoravirus inopinatum]
MQKTEPAVEPSSTPLSIYCPSPCHQHVRLCCLSRLVLCPTRYFLFLRIPVFFFCAGNPVVDGEAITRAESISTGQDAVVSQGCTFDSISGNPCNDPRLGFAALTLTDFSSGLNGQVAFTNETIWAIYEMLPWPNAVPVARDLAAGRLVQSRRSLGRAAGDLASRRNRTRKHHFLNRE